jgi:hypothetical protein
VPLSPYEVRPQEQEEKQENNKKEPEHQHKTREKTSQTSARTQNNSRIGEHHQNVLAERGTRDMTP